MTTRRTSSRSPMRRLLDALAARLWPLAVANAVCNIAIVVTGSAVRLTGSGLGCPTWPSCTTTAVHPPLELHGMIEFGNRLLTFVLAAVAILCFLAALGARRRRSTRLAFVVACSIPAQALLGGITVLTDLNPWIVALHFMVSMAIISCCVALLDDLRSPERDLAPPRLLVLAGLTFLAGWVTLYLGTVVTGSGPYAGDENAPRNGLDPGVMTSWHSIGVFVLLGSTIALLIAARASNHRRLATIAGVVLALEVAQGLVGWAQTMWGLPVALVAVHVLGAALIAAGLARIVLTVLPRSPHSGA